MISPKSVAPVPSAACLPGGFDLEVFLRVRASAKQQAVVEATLRANPQITSVHVVDRAEVLAVFRCIFAGDKKLTHNMTADALPVSFRITAAPGTDVAALRRTLARLPGVDTVGEGQPATPAS